MSQQSTPAEGPGPSQNDRLVRHSSPCHRALRCAEIFEHILQEIDAWGPVDKYASSRSLALVCKAFLEPACGVVWRELPTLKPLYRILLPDKTDIYLDNLDQPTFPELESDRWSFHHGTEEWSRFLRCAARVRKLFHLAPSSSEVELIRALVACNGGRTFLPNLRELCWRVYVSQPSQTAILGFFASPSVRTFVLAGSAYRYQDRPETSQQPALVPLVASAFPCLQSFAVNVYTPETVPEFIDGLAAMRQLRSLTFSPPDMTLSPAHMRTLASSLPHLETLSAHIGFGGSPLPEAPQQPRRAPARNLRRLYCKGSWADLAQLPTLLRCPALQGLHLTMEGYNAAPFTTLRECMDAVAAPQFARSLRTLHVLARIAWSPRSVRGGATPGAPPISFADILGVLATLEDLKHFVLALDLPRWRRPVPSCSDDDLRSVALAMRGIRRFSLRFSWVPSKAAGAPTALALMHFAELCPQLVRLVLPPLDVRGPMPTTFPADPPRCDALKLLRLKVGHQGERGGPDPRALAVFLDGLFPNLDVEASAAMDAEQENASVWAEVRVLQDIRRLCDLEVNGTTWDCSDTAMIWPSCWMWR